MFCGRALWGVALPNPKGVAVPFWGVPGPAAYSKALFHAFAEGSRKLSAAWVSENAQMSAPTGLKSPEAQLLTGSATAES